MTVSSCGISVAIFSRPGRLTGHGFIFQRVVLEFLVKYGPFPMMTMPKKGIATALILILLGVMGYFGGGRASVTALIPAFFGIPILLSSLLAIKNLKLGMHLAALFALLGFLAPFGRIIPKAVKGEFVFNLATGSMILMSLICLVFLIQCVKSFKAARLA